ncbi:hypothetical protein GCM10010442_63090 [Kitasatospora kifunensis]
MLAAAAVVVALVGWLTLGQGGDGGKQKTAQPAPATGTPSAPASITPGATPTGPAISSRPGGTGGGSGASGGGTAASGGGTGGSGGTTGGSGTASGGEAGGGAGTITSSGGGSGDGGGAGGTGGTGGTGGGTGGGGESGGGTGSGGTGSGGSGGGNPPINTSDVMALPICTASQLTLELAGTQNAYQPKEKPTFELKIRNASSAGCRVDLSQAAAAITVNSASGERIWSSADCVTDKQGRWVQVSPANALTETFVWDRTRSKPQCATPSDTSPAPAGNYLVQAELTGPSGGPVPARTSTRLDA